MNGNQSRREFLKVLPALATVPLAAQGGAGEPLLDFHQHSLYVGRTHDQLLAHQAEHRVSTTVLLPGEGWMFPEPAWAPLFKAPASALPILGGNRDCAALQSQYPDKFVRFTSSDAAESRSVDVLRGNILRGARGIGEMKYHVAVDSPEMHRIYQLADEMHVPVLIHFEFETYNTGLERFAAVLKKYPKVNFIGHAQTWWGNISADLNPLDLYPKGPVKPGGLTDKLLSDYPNIHGDLSAGSGLNALTRDPEFARAFLQRHSRKLIWGSDCPCHDGKGAGFAGGKCIAAESLAALRELVPDPASLRRMRFENGAQLLGLKRK
ncbi:MAG TPA: amidohydrolase family protein [Acidobacteriota bacterium]|jgi:predicted TIM-barrel fold metal-dependent hydrolase